MLYIASLGPEEALYGRCVALLLLSFGQERPDLLCLRSLYSCLTLRLWIRKRDCHGCMLAGLEASGVLCQVPWIAAGVRPPATNSK